MVVVGVLKTYEVEMAGFRQNGAESGKATTVDPMGFPRSGGDSGDER